MFQISDGGISGKAIFTNMLFVELQQKIKNGREIFMMNTRNSMNYGSESNEEPRFLNLFTIKAIEDIAYPEKENMESDVKIWIPKSTRK